MVGSVANAAPVHVRGRLNILLFVVRVTADFTAWVHKGVLRDIFCFFNMYVLEFFEVFDCPLSMIIDSYSTRYCFWWVGLWYHASSFGNVVLAFKDLFDLEVVVIHSIGNYCWVFQLRRSIFLSSRGRMLGQDDQVERVGSGA